MSHGKQNHSTLVYEGSPRFQIGHVDSTVPVSMPSHHYHTTYELYYLRSGQRYYFIRDNIYHIQPGMLVLIRPYDIHSTLNFANEGYNRYLINCNQEFMTELVQQAPEADLLRCFQTDVPVASFLPGDQRFAELLLDKMLEESTSSRSGREDFLKAAMIQLLLLAGRQCVHAQTLPPADPDATQQTVAKVAAYINTHYPEEITLKAVAQQFFISPCYLSRVFRRITGLPFSEYLNGVRIKEAQLLLRQSSQSISRIALDVGFNNCTHFDRVFKHTVGISPGAYRKNNRAL